MPQIWFESLASEDEEGLMSVVIDGVEQDFFAIGKIWYAPEFRGEEPFPVFVAKVIEEEGEFIYTICFNGLIPDHRFYSDDFFYDPIKITSIRKKGVITSISDYGRMDFSWPVRFEGVGERFDPKKKTSRRS